MSEGEAWTRKVRDFAGARGRSACLFVMSLALTAQGCASSLDMARSYDPGRAATTIPYAGVRGGRLFPDYEPIGTVILTGKELAAPPKSVKPKGGGK